ncbi:MAG TPA: bifunctional phosphoribosylaminoimidazolecarboxamide formyltransferase/IMP cyclohydrolase [Gemmatimonadaceae bacterium]|nr:bifunctional phosphoribosylaminoimidazolecarboxamide formyltransferase/IMP cyclohydrolase [Gemmatimonadaceae bacterium]
MRALLSVSDKTGLVDFARALVSLGWDLVSTGGTAKALRDAGLKVSDISDVTGFPEMLDGRVKTLHPKVHGGLLARRDLPEHMKAIREHDITTIDLVVVNLYPFRETAAKKDTQPHEVIEQIDIGGPSMLRSAAKNFDSVFAVVDPGDYSAVLDALRGSGDAAKLKRSLARKVFEHTAAYDGAIAAWFQSQDGDRFPARLSLSFERMQSLRYGENPGQEAAFYAERRTAGLGALEQLGGKELSFNNLLDVDGAILATEPFGDEPACAIVKHTTPCGLAVGRNALEAYEKALACDPVSAFGSVIAFTVDVDDDAARKVSELFVECVVAPAFSPGALDILATKKNLRVLRGRVAADRASLDFKRVRGGLLAQDRPPARFDDSAWKVVTKRQPTADERRDLLFAWRAVASVKSNAILLARNGATIGIGAGQMSRVDATFVATHKAKSAGHDTAGTALASDAFFPFRDGIDQAAQAGVRALVQPGGSVRDAEVIAAADEHGMTMMFTGIRLFRH